MANQQSNGSDSKSSGNKRGGRRQGGNSRNRRPQPQRRDADPLMKFSQGTPMELTFQDVIVHPRSGATRRVAEDDRRNQICPGLLSFEPTEFQPYMCTVVYKGDRGFAMPLDVLPLSKAEYDTSRLVGERQLVFTKDRQGMGLCAFDFDGVLVKSEQGYPVVEGKTKWYRIEDFGNHRVARLCRQRSNESEKGFGTLADIDGPQSALAELVTVTQLVPVNNIKGAPTQEAHISPLKEKEWNIWELLGVASDASVQDIERQGRKKLREANPESRFASFPDKEGAPYGKKVPFIFVRTVEEYFKVVELALQNALAYVAKRDEPLSGSASTDQDSQTADAGAESADDPTAETAPAVEAPQAAAPAEETGSEDTDENAESSTEGNVRQSELPAVLQDAERADDSEGDASAEAELPAEDVSPAMAKFNKRAADRLAKQEEAAARPAAGPVVEKRRRQAPLKSFAGLQDRFGSNSDEE